MQMRGIKKKVIIEQVETEDKLEQGIRWVTIEGAEYNLEAKEILQWLAKYGTLKTNLTEKLHPDCNPKFDPIGSGIYTINLLT